MSQYFSNNANTSNTISVSNNFTIADERPNILAWLSLLDPKLRHQDIRERRVESVGEWLLQTEEFRSWHTGSGGTEPDNAVLFCYGNPGVGKTYISSLVIDRLCDEARGQNATVACFYFDFAAQKEQSSTSVLRALLKQLVGGLEEVPEEVSRAYQDQKNAIGGREPGPSDVVKMLQTTFSKKRTFICIDALDECVEGHRVKLLGSLGQILQKSPGTRILVTGRPHVHSEIRRHFAGRVMSVSISPKRHDIVRYLHSRLGDDTNPDAMDRSLEADILRKIPEDISEIFLLVSLNIDAILQEITISRRRQKLSAMTDGLGLEGAYGATLGRIKGQGGEKSRLGMAALMWISHSVRPLKADELCHALAVEIGSLNLNADNILSIRTLLACCQGLVAVDKESSTVRLIHFTLQEYLRAHPELFAPAHTTMAETCLSYLNSQQVKALPTSPFPDLQGIPFLEYSSLYWGVHAKNDLSGCAKSLALKLFDDFNNHISTKVLLRAQKPYCYFVDFDEPTLFGSLHCASIFGIVEIVASLVEVEGCDVNQKDSFGNTPLVWAAKNGYEGVLKILLGRGDLNADKPDMYGRTPLCCACFYGHEGVVKMLLERHDISPNKADKYDRTPLSSAAFNGYEGVVQILLGREDVDADKSNEYGRTPLWYAAQNGHEGVVRALLRRDDVNPDRLDKDGQTPLWRAAWNGHLGVVKALLGRVDVSPDKLDADSRTPLWCASENGQEGVVKILLELDSVSPNKPDMHGQTPLCCASWNGHEGVVEMLLGRGDINPDKPDDDGRTPLWCAAENGRDGVVKILLRRSDVNPDKPDKYDQTPLWCASWHGHERIVEILLGRHDVNSNKADKYGRTPLSCATKRGHVGVITLLRPPASTTSSTA